MSDEQEPVVLTSDENVAAAKSEAAGDVAEFSFHGVDYTFKRKMLTSYQAAERFKANDNMGAYRVILGAVQWDAMVQSEADEDGCTPIKTIGEFMAQLDKAVGVPN